MKRLFTMALVLIIGLSMSAQVNSTNIKGKYTQEQIIKMNNDLNTSPRTRSILLPTYQKKGTTYINETFATEIPATWTVVNDSTTGYGWAWDDGNYSSYPYGKGNACANSDAAGSSGIGTTDLLSPIVDCSGASSLILMYNYQFKKYSSDPDTGYVYVFDGTDWVEVAKYSSDITPTSEIIDVTAYKNANFQVMFRYTDGGNWDWMFNVSDVMLFEPFANDLFVTSVSHTSTLNNTITPNVNVLNYGTDTAFNFDVSVVINDGTTDVYTSTLTFSDTLTFMEDSTFVMPDSWTANTAGTYTITAYTTYPADSDNTNDTIIDTLKVIEPSYTNGFVYGYNAYDASGSGFGNMAVSLTQSKGTQAGLMTGTSSDFMTCGDYINGMVYGVEYGTNDLYLINGDGEMILLGTISGVNSVTGLAYNPDNGTVYVSDYNTSSDLYILNEDLSTTLVGTIESSMVIGIAADTLGNLYGVDLDDNFIKIDTATGAGTVVGPLGIDINYTQDIGTDYLNNRIFGTLYTTSGGYYEIDTTTGAATLIKDFGDEITMCAIVPNEDYTATFNVDDGTNPLGGVAIDLDGYYSATTDTLGVATLQLYPDTYPFSATLSGYADYIDTFAVVDKDTNVNIAMTQVFNVKFTVTDGTDPLSGANVNINGTDLTTDNSGQDSISLAPGDYPYTVSLNGYADYLDTVTVVDADTNVNIAMTQVFNVKFTVTDGTDSLEGANVNINGTDLTTDTLGQASTLLVPGVYPYTVSLTGYDDYLDTLTVVDTALNVDVVMNNTKYNVTFNVDMSAPIEAGDFVVGTDTVFVTGDMLGWAEPGTDVANQMMSDPEGDSIYTKVLELPAGAIAYKYFKNSSFNNGEWDGGDNRTFEVTGDATLNDIWGDINNAVNAVSIANVKFAPNPTNGVLRISADNNYNVTVYDITGRVVATSVMTNNTTSIDLTKAQSGVYLVKLNNGQQSATYKIIKK